MQIIIDLDERIEEGQVPDVLRSMAESYASDRASGDEGGTVYLPDGNTAADWTVYAQKQFDV